MLVAGGIAAAAAAFLAGTSGFGFGLVATPLLLLVGFSLPFVVTANLLASMATRVVVSARLRRDISPRRVLLLVGGSVPGLYIGARTLSSVDLHLVKIATGALVMLASALLVLEDRRPPESHGRGLTPLAGFLGGFLGTTTSLIGVPPALLLARRRLATRSFIADLAVYFVVTGAIGLIVLAAHDAFSRRALYPAFVAWLPGVMLANALGTTVGLRLSERRFRLFTLAVAFAAGAVTVATA